MASAAAAPGGRGKRAAANAARPRHAAASAALQAHMMKAMQGSPGANSPPRRATTASKGPLSAAAIPARAPPALALARLHELVDIPEPPTLAEQMKLVARKGRPLLSDAEWLGAKARSDARGDSLQPCAICREPFTAARAQVLLSCTHVFHRVCVHAFERHIGKRSCPLCRTEDYEKRVTTEGQFQHRVRCAVRIQAAWRGHAARKRLLQTHAGHPGLLRLQTRVEVRRRTARLCLATDEHAAVVDSFLAKLDASVQQARDRIAAATHKVASQAVSQAEWARARAAAPDRLQHDCPICLTGLTPAAGGASPRDVLLLSCSHAFHQHCLATFERFGAPHGLPVCPLCRSFYQSEKLAIDAQET